MVAVSSGWTEDIEAGAYPGGACYNYASGDYVSTACAKGPSGWSVTVDLSPSDACSPSLQTQCENPRATGGLTNCYFGTYPTTVCSLTQIGSSGSFGGTISVDVYTTTNPITFLYTETHAWHGDIFPNNVSNPPSTGNVPSPNRSCDPCKGNTVNPVNVITGELWYRHTDAALSGPFGLTFKRYYTSQTTFSGDLGNNWRHTYDANLDVSRLATLGQVWAYDNENTYSVFNGVSNGSTSYDSTSGLTLALNSSGSTYTLTSFSGVVSTFDSTGRLLSVEDRIGNLQTVARDASHAYRISAVTDSLGRSLNFGYDSSNRITSVTSTPSGISMTLAYGGTGCGSNDLCSITESDGKKWTYQYATSNTAFPHDLTQVTDPNGNTQEVNIYQSLQNIIQEQYIWSNPGLVDTFPFGEKGPP